MKESVNVQWNKNLSFEAQFGSGHTLLMDAKEEAGGENKGPRPKPLLLAALAGCTGMDVVSILKKMRVEFDDLKISVDGDLTEEHPKHFTNMHVTYFFKGKNLPMDKLQKAVDMSADKYCGVSASLKGSIDITYEIIIEE